MAENVIAIGDSDVLLINEQYQRRLEYDNKSSPGSIFEEGRGLNRNTIKSYRYNL